MHLWVLVLFILSSCCSSDCFNPSRKRLVININSILDNRRHHHIDTICDDKTTNIMTIPSVKSSETSSTLLWIYKVMVSASLLIAVALPLPAHSEIDSKLLKKSLSTDVPIQTIQTNNKSPQQAAKVKTHRVLLREERRLETATQTRDFFKQRLDKANSALTKKKARLFVLQGQKRQGEAEIMKLDRLLKLMKKSVNNSSRDSLRSLVTALSHERQILFDVRYLLIN